MRFQPYSRFISKSTHARAHTHAQQNAGELRNGACEHVGVCPEPDLQGLLQNPDGEAPGGVRGEPQAEVWVGLGDPLQGLLQVLQPLDQEMAVL